MEQAINYIFKKRIHIWLHACMHTYIHTYKHTYIHTYIHTYVIACMHAYIHTYIHDCMHTYVHTYILKKLGKNTEGIVGTRYGAHTCQYYRMKCGRKNVFRTCSVLFLFVTFSCNIIKSLLQCFYFWLEGYPLFLWVWRRGMMKSLWQLTMLLTSEP